MLQDPLLLDTYKLYKAGTSKVVGWLASKAPESFNKTLLKEKSGKPGGGRLKGKERAAQKARESATPKAEVEKYLISLADIPRIAKIIASTTKMKVPADIIQTLEDVIAARSTFSKSFV